MRKLVIHVISWVLIVGTLCSAPLSVEAADPKPDQAQGQLTAPKTPFWTNLKEYIAELLDKLANKQSDESSDKTKTTGKTNPKNQKDPDPNAFNYSVYSGYLTMSQDERKRYINQLQPYVIPDGLPHIYCLGEKTSYEWNPFEVPITIRFPKGWCMEFKYNLFARFIPPSVRTVNEIPAEAQSGWIFFKKELTPGVLTKPFIPTKPVSPVTEEEPPATDESQDDAISSEDAEENQQQEKAAVTTEVPVSFFMGNNFVVDYKTDCEKERAELEKVNRPKDMNRYFCSFGTGRGIFVQNINHTFTFNNYDGDYSAIKYSSDRLHNVIIDAYDMAQNPLGVTFTANSNYNYRDQFNEWADGQANTQGYVRNTLEEQRWKSQGKLKGEATAVFDVYVKCAPPPNGAQSSMPMLIGLAQKPNPLLVKEHLGGCRPELGMRNNFAPTGERAYLALKGQMLYVIRTDSYKLFWEECKPVVWTQPTAVELKNQCVVKSVIGADRIVDELANNKDNPSKLLKDRLHEWNRLHSHDKQIADTQNVHSQYYIIYNLQFRDKCVAGYVMNNQTGGRCMKPDDIKKSQPVVPKFKRCLYGEVIQESQPCPEDAFNSR